MPGFPRVSINGAVLLILTTVFAAGCGEKPQEELIDARFYFDRGSQEMERKQYQKAIDDFQTVVDSFSGSELVDSAQFMLAEAHFRNEDYLAAAFEYERVYTDFPASEHAEEAWYKKALCYFEESPKAPLDQENTQLAIDEFNRFIENFPDSEFRDDAIKKIDELREKLAYKQYRIAELYRKSKFLDGHLEAAIIYYDAVITEYPRSAWVPPSRYGMGTVYMRQIDRDDELLEDLRDMDEPDTAVIEETLEGLREKYENAVSAFTIVINSGAEKSLKDKASEKLRELEEKYGDTYGAK